MDLPEALLDLQAAPVAGDPVHHSHHRLLDHLAADETLQHLGHLHTLFGVLSAEHLHLLEQGSVGGASVGGAVPTQKPPTPRLLLFPWTSPLPPLTRPPGTLPDCRVT